MGGERPPLEREAVHGRVSVGQYMGTCVSVGQYMGTCVSVGQ